jgi:hypothetical protein
MYIYNFVRASVPWNVLMSDMALALPDRKHVASLSLNYSVTDSYMQAYDCDTVLSDSLNRTTN